VLNHRAGFGQGSKTILLRLAQRFLKKKKNAKKKEHPYRRARKKKKHMLKTVSGRLHGLRTTGARGKPAFGNSGAAVENFRGAMFFFPGGPDEFRSEGEPWPAGGDYPHRELEKQRFLRYCKKQPSSPLRFVGKRLKGKAYRKGRKERQGKNIPADPEGTGGQFGSQRVVGKSINKKDRSNSRIQGGGGGGGD